MLDSFTSAVDRLVGPSLQLVRAGRRRRAFARVGFREVACAYRQPALAHAGERRDAGRPALALMYKGFGAGAPGAVLGRDEFLTALGGIFQIVYGVADPEGDPGFAAARAAPLAWPHATAAFR